ncbi:MAG: DUF5107 domain-containing protein [Pyrinomonadaceae bacterium]|nr:DUF5107 domain-containing protein [Pyrinomonadaceae bacterium]
MKNNRVKIWTEEVNIPTYLPALPDKNPMFLEKRVYQGSSGKVYPLPFTDRISETKTDKIWKAIYLENEYLQVMILPEIGGRIHAILDKTNGYDLIYRQEVIKPALVGLTGSWISGGIEFNWAQHHRPATFMPVDFSIEEHSDGSKTVWLSDHEPMTRMKGMHGVCLYPDKAFVELKARVYNRTPFTQTFLWWANAATKVHEGYQSFFPPDVYYIADHAKRAMSEYPLCQGFYYGVNYGERAKNGIPHDEIPSKFIPSHCQKAESKTKDQRSKIPDYQPNDLSWYANIPVPTSYMCMGSQEDFFGGYDHFADAGVAHIANHHIAPGKKQWTWGNHEFGYAWDRNLSDDEAPYIELMAGVFTDNQPDFSFLQPYETKSWSQYWYGINKIGVPNQANLNAALNLQVDKKTIKIGVNATSVFPKAKICLESVKKKLEWTADLAPEKPFIIELKNERNFVETESKLTVFDENGEEIISFQPKLRIEKEVPPPATEPLLPEEIESVEELYLTGLHLEQYRHATRKPEIYWEEGLKRDSLDSRCNNALGLWYMRRGEFEKAENHFRQAIERLTKRNPNPADGEAFYNLGLCLQFQSSKSEESYSAFYKATWNQGWASSAFFALAQIDCQRKDWINALEHLNKALNLNSENLKARNLKVIVLDVLGRQSESESLLNQTLTFDKLDWFARFLSGEDINCDSQIKLDIAHDLAKAGFFELAIKCLENDLTSKFSDLTDQNLGTSSLIFYTLGCLYQKNGEENKAKNYFIKAAKESPDYCFPHRLEEIEILQTAIRVNPKDSYAPYYLGNLFYDRGRYDEAIKLWEKSVKLNPNFSIVWRNLGIGYFNIFQNSNKANEAYNKAFKTNPNDARILFERDQLWKRIGESSEKRLQELEKYPDLVARRDDLTVEICSLYNQTNQSEKALQMLESRQFQPWEGGEGQTLNQFVTANLLLGKKAIAKNHPAKAEEFFLKCLNPPQNLSETHHLLANKSDIYFWLGIAQEKLGNLAKAKEFWTFSANAKGDFQEMSVTEYSEMTLFSALSLLKLKQEKEANNLLNQLLKFAQKLEKSKAKIDYFATSLPTMLLFDDDINKRQETKALFLQAQAYFGLGKIKKAEKLIEQVLKNDPNHQLALTILEIKL